MNRSEISETDTHELHRLADGLKQDAKSLWEAGNKPEAMKLLRLFRGIARELHCRRNPARAHLWN